ncbi:MAG: hypothetical protein ACMUJM_23440 [bacterium]
MRINSSRNHVILQGRFNPSINESIILSEARNSNFYVISPDVPGDPYLISIPGSLLFKSLELKITQLRKNETLVEFRGSLFKALGLLLSILLFAALFVGTLFLFIFPQSLLNMFYGNDPFSSHLFLLFIIVFFVFGVIIFEEYRAWLSLRQLLSKLPAEYRLVSQDYFSIDQIRRDLITHFLIWVLWIPILMLVAPKFLAMMILILSLIKAIGVWISGTLNVVAYQRIHRLYEWQDRFMPYICFFFIGITIFSSYCFQWCFVWLSRELPPNQLFVTPGINVMIGAPHWFRHTAGTKQGLIEFREAVAAFQASFIHRTQIESTNQILWQFSLLIAVFMFFVFIRGWLSRTAILKPAGIFIGTVPEIISKRFIIGSVSFFAIGFAETLLALYLSFLTILHIVSPEILNKLPCNSLVYPLQVLYSIRSVPNFDIKLTGRILILIYLIPSFVIFLEICSLIIRDMKVAISLNMNKVENDNELTDLRSLWLKWIPGENFPRIFISKKFTELPEVRFILFPPFRYIVLPRWFNKNFLKGILDEKDLALVLAHEDYHYSQKWRAQFVTYVLGIISLRHPNCSLLFTTGLDEFNADKYACNITKIEDAKERLSKALNKVTRARRPPPKDKHHQNIWGGVLNRFILNTNQISKAYPSNVERERKLKAQITEPSGKKQSKGLIDVIFPVLIGISIAALFIELGKWPSNILPKFAQGSFRIALASSHEKLIRDLQKRDERIFLLEDDQVQIIDARSLNIEKSISDLPLLNPSQVLPIGEDEFLVGSGYSGLMLYSQGRWSNIDFGTHKRPAVLALSYAKDGEILVATTSGLWKLNNSIRLAALIFGEDQICTSVAYIDSKILIGTTNGLFSLNNNVVNKLNSGHVLALDAFGDDWIVALGYESKDIIKIEGSCCGGVRLHEIAGGFSRDDHVVDIAVSGGKAVIIQSKQGWASSLLAICEDGEWKKIDELSRERDLRQVLIDNEQIYFTDRARLFRLYNNAIFEVKLDENQPFPQIEAMTVDKSGQVWISSGGFVWVLREGLWTKIGPGTPKKLSHGTGYKMFFLPCRTTDCVWMMTQKSLVFMMETSYREYMFPEKWHFEPIGFTLTEDDYPLVVLANGKVVTIKDEDWVQLSALDWNKAFYCDMVELENYLWILGSEGGWWINLADGSTGRIRDSSYSPGEIARLSENKAIKISINGGIWLLDAKSSSIQQIDDIGVPVSSIYAINGKDILIATYEPNKIIRYTEQGVETVFRDSDGLPNVWKIGLVKDKLDKLWFFDSNGNLWSQQ